MKRTEKWGRRQEKSKHHDSSGREPILGFLNNGRLVWEWDWPSLISWKSYNWTIISDMRQICSWIDGEVFASTSRNCALDFAQDHENILAACLEVSCLLVTDIIVYQSGMYASDALVLLNILSSNAMMRCTHTTYTQRHRAAHDSNIKSLDHHRCDRKKFSRNIYPGRIQCNQTCTPLVITSKKEAPHQSIPNEKGSKNQNPIFGNLSKKK